MNLFSSHLPLGQNACSLDAIMKFTTEASLRETATFSRFSFTPLPTWMTISSRATSGMHRRSPDEAKGHLIDVEQHSFMLILLKVLATKADSMLLPSTQIEGIRKYLTTHEASFTDEAQTALNKVQLGGRDKEYVSAVKTYALSAHKLLTPVNIWVIPLTSPIWPCSGVCIAKQVESGVNRLWKVRDHLVVGSPLV